MIKSSHNSTYEEIYSNLSFPIIILSTDLSILYMNTEAKNTYGKYFKNPIWKSKIFNEGIIEEITALIEKGETVTVSPPQINEFTKMLFQPIIGSDGKISAVRLNVDLFKSGPHTFDSYEAFNSMYDRTKGVLNTAQMAAEVLIDRAGRPDASKYASIIYDNMDKLGSNLKNSEYLFNLINRHNLKHETMFNPLELIQEIVDKTDGTKIKSVTDDNTQTLFDATAFEYAIDLIINYLKAISEGNEIKLESYEKESHFVFVFKTKRVLDIQTDKETLNHYQVNMEILKEQSEKLGGNLVQIIRGSKIKILYSIKKHLRSEYSMAFRQDTELL